MQDRIFYSICFGFISGIFLRSLTFVDVYLVVLFGIIALVLLFFFKFISPRHSRATGSKNKWGIILGIFILSFSFGIFRFHLADVPAPQIFESQVNQKVILVGKIVDEPSLSENNQKLVVEIVEKDSKSKILLSSNLDEVYKYGDEIKFEGKLEKPDNFMTDQNKEFDYINYLRKDGIFYSERYPKIEILSHENGNFIKSALFSVKEFFINKISLVIREPESLFMNGLILGEKSSFGQSLRQSFVNTGTIHIVALSGYNVTIVAEWIMKIFAFLPKNLGIFAGILAIILFVLMTGGSSTAIRAGIMATLALAARLIGRNYDVTRALILAGVFMVLINPFILVFDVSFQLSFIATVAVIYFSPKLEKHFLWVTDKFGLRDIVSVTCAAYIFVLPFILYKMGNLSLVALPANTLILPFIPFTMILGFLTGFIGIISYVFSVPFGYISYLFLHYELSIISFFSNIPFASLTIPDFPLIFTILIYAYFIYRLFGRSIKSFFTEPF